MGAALRYILLAVFFAGFAAQIVEPFAAEAYEQWGLDSSKWVVPVMTFLQSGAAWPPFLVVIGMTTGVWLHWLATKFDRQAMVKRRHPEKPDQSLIGSRCQALARDIREATASFGRGKAAHVLLSEYDVIRWELRAYGINMTRRNSEDPLEFLKAIAPALERLAPYLLAYRIAEWRSENPRSNWVKNGWFRRPLHRDK